MQGSHTHIPGTNHVPRGYIVAVILSLLFMVPLCLVPALALLFFYKPFLPGTSLETAVIPTAQASSFTLQYFPYYV